jgi:crotonyl-CoA carboxylase/reductase
MSEVFSWTRIPEAHMKMWRNEHAPGNMAALVMAPRPGLKTFRETIAAAREGARVSEAA